MFAEGRRRQSLYVCLDRSGRLIGTRPSRMGFRFPSAPTKRIRRKPLESVEMLAMIYLPFFLLGLLATIRSPRYFPIASSPSIERPRSPFTNRDKADLSIPVSLANSPKVLPESATIRRNWFVNRSAVFFLIGTILPVCCHNVNTTQRIATARRSRPLPFAHFHTPHKPRDWLCRGRLPPRS
jgi:hypothetical protein